MLENLKPAERISAKIAPRPSVEFNGEEGTAVTHGYDSEPENFDEFLLDAGLNPADIEVIPPVRTSRWQQQRDGELIWLTSYRFTFRRKASSVDLPLLVQAAKKKVKPKPLASTTEKALVILWSDLQVGKVDMLGNLETLIQRVTDTRAKLIKQVRSEKPERVVFIDLGDTVENFSNKADMQQLHLSQVSIMDQVQLATTMAWETLSEVARLVPNVTYASVGSNHCQWRVNKQVVGKATDDWGVFIGRQLAMLAEASGADNITFVEPQEWDESLAVDVFDDEFHILGIVHGHQVRRPAEIRRWWSNQMFGNQPVAAATILTHGHFHHLSVEEVGQAHNGQSRFRIGAPTLDNGSNWFRNATGEQSTPGLATFILEKNIPFGGTVFKL